MSVLALLILGAAAGFIATRLMRLETGIPVTIAIGALGALLGGLVLRLMLSVFSWVAVFVGAVLGAMALIWLWRVYMDRR